MLCNVNIWALLVSTVVSLIVAGLWYSDYVFGKEWRSYNGNLFTNLPSDKKKMLQLYGAQFVLTLITNFILARALFYVGASTWFQSIAVAIALWIGFVAAVSASSVVWEKKPLKLVAINAGSYLATILVASIIFGLWN